MPAQHNMHHHRGCKGKAHASGIAKQTRQLVQPCQGWTPRSPARDPPKSPYRSPIKAQRLRSNEDEERYKFSRNSTSSWDYSDSDSIHSSDTGVPLDLHDRKFHVFADDKDIYGFDRRNTLHRSQSTRRSIKKESWADTLRSSNGSCEEKYKKMEQGWDDSNVVIRNPKERKWHRITAEIEQRDQGVPLQRRNSLPPKKLVRKNSSSRRDAESLSEWRELFELALSRKIVNGKLKGKSFGDDVVDHSGGYFLKHLDALLVHSKAPRAAEVL